jgi:hypothetical protein
MSTSDNSSLQGTPGGTATMGMLARAIIQRGQITTNVAMPGIVTAWRPPVSAGSESKPAMVDVRPDFKYARAIDVDDSAGPTEEVRDDPTRGKLAIGTLPVIPNVPVCYLGSGGMQVRGPIEVGECGLIVFCDRDIDDWIQDGGPAEPIMRHARHALINAIFIPGLRYGTVAHPVDPLLYFVGREDQTAGLSLHAETKDLQLLTEGTITLSKQGVVVATVEMDAAGAITITPAAGQNVNVGGAGAVSLVKAQSLELALIAAANAVTGTPDVEAGFVAFAGFLAGLASTTGTTVAKGI